ncbi:hypothetical protein SAMN04488583_6383 [Mycobacterium sp. 88mf]|nr:hypothetical protein SAMN04488583_6383 [Mycobacterium sp. 88mf]SFG61696.1 hypothetical protein SAMN04488582_11083 [Mycobacterium sp. 455mf]
MFWGGISMCVSLWLTDLGIGFTHPEWLFRFNAEWLKAHAYIPNILAGITGFLIGVPVALVVLETIRSDYTQNVQIEAVRRISLAAWSDFSEAVADLCTDDRIKAIGNTEDDSSPTDLLKVEHDVLIEALESCRDEIRKDPSLASVRFTELKSFLQLHLPIFRERYKAVNKAFGVDYKLRRQWSYTLALWELIDTHIRLRRLEFGLEKIDTDSYMRLREQMTSPENPIFEFLGVHSKQSDEKGVRSMADLLSILDLIPTLSDSQLAYILDEAYSEYIGTGVANYWSEAYSANSFLFMLKASALSVSLSGDFRHNGADKTVRQANAK